MERYGRKMCLLIHCIPAMLGWVALLFAEDLLLIMIGRFLAGISVGMLGPPSSILIGESSDPKYRGILLSGISLAISIGVLVAHILGTFLTWKTMSIVCSAFPLITFVWIMTIPETPSWLMRQDRLAEAENSFRWLRGYTPAVTEELENMMRKHELDQALHEGDISAMEKLRIAMKKPEFLKPLMIVLGFFFVMQASGINTVAFYTVSIMKDILGDTIDEYLSMIIVDIVRVLMSAVACVLTRTMYRKSLTLFSGVGSGLCMQALAIFMYVSKQYPEKLGHLSWISLIFLIGYICFMNSGIFALPWILSG
jgi:facilitated trehalose transporter